MLCKENFMVRGMLEIITRDHFLTAWLNVPATCLKMEFSDGYDFEEFAEYFNAKGCVSVDL